MRLLLSTTVDWPSAARLAGAFAQLGAQVSALFPRRHVLSVSRYPQGKYLYRPLHPLASLREAIAAAEPDRVIPCDDRALAQLLELAEREPSFRELMTRSLGDLASYPVMQSRSAAIQTAREAGIAAPLTLAVACEADLPAALAGTGLPCLLKSDGSWGGDGVILVHGLKEARQAFRRLHGPPSRLRSLVRAGWRKDLHFLAEAWAPRPAAVNVQAYVPGKPATSVFACRDGEVLASLHMDVVAWRGTTGPASLMRRVSGGPMEEAGRRLGRRFKLDGLFGLDFMRDGEGVPRLIEINPRAAQICHLALDADLPAALLGAPPRPPVTERPVIALYPQLLDYRADLPGVYADMPWDDPAIVQALAGEDVLEWPLGMAGKMPVFRPGELYRPRSR